MRNCCRQWQRQVPLTQRNCSRSQVTQVPHLRSASVSAANQRQDAPGVLNSLLERQQDARPQSCGKNASTHLTYGSMRWKRLANHVYKYAKLATNSFALRSMTVIIGHHGAAMKHSCKSYFSALQLAPSILASIIFKHRLYVTQNIL